MASSSCEVTKPTVLRRYRQATGFSTAPQRPWRSSRLGGRDFSFTPGHRWQEPQFSFPMVFRLI
ncbi:MAG TPA: hypothetical protein VHB45_12705 [Alloacidobacterium sp.]|nr:hypothetical protein [Alloacidobacterium sp.]